MVDVLVIFLVVFIFWSVMLARNLLIYNIRKKKRVETSIMARKIINDYYTYSRGDGNWEVVWDEFENGPSYNKMMLTLWKWRYKSFYPNKPK